MNIKNTLIVIGILAVGFIAGHYLVSGTRILGGIPNASYGLKSSNNSSTICGVTTNVIIATDSARTSFEASIGTSNAGTVTVCRAASCVAQTGGIILSSSSWNYYEQNDAYYGPYSCVANTTTTLGISYSP